MNPSTLIQVGLLGEALDGGPAAVFVADEDMNYIAVNEYACRLLGYTREELLRLRVTDVAPYPQAPDEYAELVANGQRDGRARLVRKDGSDVVFRYRAGETTVAGMPVYVAVGVADA